MNITNQLFMMRKRLKDDDLRKIKKITEEEMIRRDSHRQTQKTKSGVNK